MKTRTLLIPLMIFIAFAISYADSCNYQLNQTASKWNYDIYSDSNHICRDNLIADGGIRRFKNITTGNLQLVNGTYIEGDFNNWYSSENYTTAVFTGEYRILIQKNFSRDEPVLFYRNQTNETWFKFYFNNIGYEDLNSSSKIADKNNVNGTAYQNQFKWNNAFGSGIDLAYVYGMDQLYKNLTISNLSNLPSPNASETDSGNTYFFLKMKIKRSDDIRIWIDNSLWNESADLITSYPIYFKSFPANITLFHIPTIQAYDSSGSSTIGNIAMRKAGGNIFLLIRTDYSWINSSSRIYPIWIDPDLIIDGTTQTLWGNQSYDNVVINNSGILYITQASGDTGGWINFTTINFTLDSTSQIIGTGRGGTGGIGGTACPRIDGTNGTQPSGTSGGGEGGDSSDNACTPDVHFAGGGGGSGGAEGGSGANGGGGVGGINYSVNTSKILNQFGSGGGGGGGAWVWSVGLQGGNGGNGGANIKINSTYVNLFGNISLNGTNGGNGTATGTNCPPENWWVWSAGGGAGSGGEAILYGDYVNITNLKLNAKGGDGGWKIEWYNCWEASQIGGGGGGGATKIFYRYSLSNSSSIINVSKGAGGSSSANNGYVFYSLIYDINIENDSYVSPVYEYSSNPFLLSISTSGNITNVEANLSYNNSWYSPTKTQSGGNYNFSKSITAPFVTINNTNFTFYWNYTVFLSDGSNITFNSTSHNQTVMQTTFNINAFDERSLANITFNLTMINTTFSQTFNNLINGVNTTFNHSYTGSKTLVVSSYGYIDRNYYFYISPNQSTSLDTYLLQSGDGVTITYWIYSNQYPLGEDSSMIHALKFINGSWRIVAEQRSDNQGKGILYLDPLTIYGINAENAAGTLYRNYSSYSPNPNFIFRINLNGDPSSEGNGTQPSSLFIPNITFSLSPTDIYLRKNNVSNITLFNFTVNSPFGDLQWQQLKLIYWNGTVLYSSNITTSSGTSIMVNLNYGSLNSTLKAEASFKRSNYSVYSINRTYIITDSLASNTNVIPQTINESKGFFSLTILSLIALFVSFGIAEIVGKIWRTGAGIIFLGVLTIFTLFEFFSWGFLIGLWLMEVGFLMYREII